jgi:TatD DNase family protein
VDSHAHIDRFPPEERDAVLARAWEAGLEKIVSVATALDGVDTLRQLVELNPGKVFCTVGTHPTELDGGVPAQKEFIDAVERIAPVAIGETGIDLFSAAKSASPQRLAERQKRAFFLQVCIARDLGLPLVIHCREEEKGRLDAWNIVQRTLKDAKVDTEWALIHCFDYSYQELVPWQKSGGFVSFSGTLTHKGNVNVQQAITFTHVGRFLLETDSPFLIPEPLRSEKKVKCCEPAHMVHTARFAAELMEYEYEAVLQCSLKNGNKFFRLEK